MQSFRVTSQRSSSGNKKIGGLQSSSIGTSSVNKRSQSRRAYGSRNYFFNSSYSNSNSNTSSNFTHLTANTYAVTWASTPPAGVYLPTSIVATGNSSSNYQLQFESNNSTTNMLWYENSYNTDLANYYAGNAAIIEETPPIMQFQLGKNSNTYTVRYNITAPTTPWISGTLTPLSSSSSS